VFASFSHQALSGLPELLLFYSHFEINGILAAGDQFEVRIRGETFDELTNETMYSYDSNTITFGQPGAFSRNITDFDIPEFARPFIGFRGHLEMRLLPAIVALVDGDISLLDNGFVTSSLTLGSGGSGGGPAEVPEPSTFALGAIGVIAGLSYCLRRSRQRVSA
jgi:hypothetical protein